MRKFFILLLIVIPDYQIFCEDLIDIDGIWEGTGTVGGGLSEYIAIEQMNENSYFIVYHDPWINDNCFAEIGYYDGEYIEILNKTTTMHIRLPLSNAPTSLLYFYPFGKEHSFLPFKRLNVELKKELSQEEEDEMWSDFAKRVVESKESEEETNNK